MNLNQELFFDGWYAYKEDARACLGGCVNMGATAVGLVESENGTYGILYFSPRVLFDNHKIDQENAILAALRQHA